MAAARIVAIDDSPMILRAVKLALEKAGYAVTTLDSPSAFESVKAVQPDLLLDINMPELYGDDAVEFSDRMAHRSPHLSVLRYSWRKSCGSAPVTCGANGYICKGWGLDVLVQRVDAVLKASQAS